MIGSVLESALYGLGTYHFQFLYDELEMQINVMSAY
jgi:hypothetical protein